MKFKKLEIYGFKSFADKIEVKFESGVTAIVGPNGCGKSNVADAVRWVLGEQSAKVLRGSSMQDVIFNGTESRKSQSFCEVSLYFDNSTRIFPLDYDEVVISRKLYRSGDSEYSINRNVCRLKDIVEVLRDSGLGKESYSIIGQGRIDEILSAKPEERRAVFEEAAGISKFKSRKIDAERKLEHTTLNLTRINDIIFELERQIEPLTKQSENAKKYLEFKERLKTLEINTYVYQYDSASANKATINSRIQGINEELSLKEKELEACITSYDQTMDDIQKLDDTIETLRDELLSLTVGLEKQSGETKLLQEKIFNLKDHNKILESNMSSGDEEATTITAVLSAKREDLTLKTTVVQELKRKIEKVNDEYLFLVDKMTASEEFAESSGNQMIEALDKLSDVKSKISGLETEKTTLLSKQDDIKNKRRELSLKVNDYQEELQDVTGSLMRLKNSKKEVGLNLDKFVSVYNENTKNIDALTKEIDVLNASYHTTISRHKVLSEMQEDNEGFGFAVKKILSDSKTNASLGGAVIGVVAKLMKVPQKYETAIEMALGALVQNIVTKNEDDAKLIIDYLKNKRYGRATFLPISSMKSRPLPNEYRQYLKSKGCFGIASELVEYDKAHASIFSSLLGSTVIVDNIDTAINLAKVTKYGFKLVTLEGDVLATSGSVSGGSMKNDGAKIIGREREIEQLAASIKETRQEIDKKLALKKELSEKQVTLSAEIKEYNQKTHMYDLDIVKETDRLSKVKAFVGELTEEIDLLNLQYKQNELKSNQVNKDLLHITAIEKEISIKKTDAFESKRQVTGEFDELKKRRETLYQDLTDTKIKEASATSEIRAIESDISRFEEEISGLKLRSHTNKALYQKNLTMLTALEEDLKKVTSKSNYSNSISALQEVRDKLAKLDNSKSSLHTTVQELDAKKMIYSGEIQDIRDKKFKEEMQLSKIDSDIEIMQERVWEEYNLTYSSAVNYRTDGYKLEEGIAESAKIKRQIQHLGYINVNAIETLAEVSTRYNDLSKQRDDLEKAKQDLLNIIKELTDQMQVKFVTQFNKINQNFQKVFKELFGGGKAELVLQENESVLDAGIDIIAEPPGKKLQSITLLSGGERALTAIAILFAILKLKPMPFCVLDEIEAALDDTNAERFAKYLNRFSETTQFIVITHRKPTMELADALYGVTMEEKGVSKMVSVQLSEAVKNSEEANV